MSSKLRVEFGLPQHGWISFNIICGDSDFSICASYTPYDSVGALTSAICQIAKGIPEVMVPWNEEPVEHELHFKGDAALTSFTITSHPDHSRIQGTGQQAFEAHGSRLDICLAFWRALRRLESSLKASDFERAWGHPFPTEKLEELTQIMQRMKAREVED